MRRQNRTQSTLSSAGRVVSVEDYMSGQHRIVTSAKKSCRRHGRGRRINGSERERKPRRS